MTTLGLDIGGANLKAAHSGGWAWSEPFSLWRAPGELTDRLDRLASRAPAWDRLAVTMTAELCDCFPTKRRGVNHVLDAVEAVARGRPIGVWSTTRGRDSGGGCFVDPAWARREPLHCAASNWHALATHVANRFPHGLTVLIDTGSTTTDVLLLKDGQPQPFGFNDTDRLATGELVYVGAWRTPLIALGPTITWRKRTYNLMAECFADTGDVYLLTGEHPEQPDRTDTPDGRARTPPHAATRLLRMIGADLETASPPDAVDLAEVFRAELHRRVAGSIRRVLNGQPPHRVVTSGSGDHVADVAARIALPGVPRVRLATAIGDRASAAACAYALVWIMDPTGRIGPRINTVACAIPRKHGLDG